MEHNITPVAGTLNMTIDYASLQSRMQELQRFVKSYMISGEDYGNIPGTDKPTLLKSGAEKLCDVYCLAVGKPYIEYVRDDSKSPTYISYQVTTPLVSRSDGRVIMHGVGSCNSHEKKYKWRWVFESELPPGVNPGTLKTKESNTKRGKTFKYQIPNDEIDDLDNTILKMAKKRSLVDAVLSATRSSALFTQDVEDMADMEIKQQDTSKRDEQRQQQASQNQQSNSFNGADATQAQIGAINKIKDQKNISEEDFKRMIAEISEGKVELAQLTKREASELITFLNNYQAA